MYLAYVSVGMYNHRLDNVQVFDVLETVSQIAEERMVEVLEHPPLTDYVANAFRPYHCYTTSVS